MPFPLSIEGTALLSRAQRIGPELVEHAAAAVIAQGGVVLERDERSLNFRVPFERVPLWFFSRGTLSFEDSTLGPTLYYRASCQRSALVTGCLAGLLGAIAAAAGSLAQGAAVTVIGWLWLFGVHYAAQSGSFAGRFNHISGEPSAAAKELA